MVLTDLGGIKKCKMAKVIFIINIEDPTHPSREAFGVSLCMCVCVVCVLCVCVVCVCVCVCVCLCV